MPKGTNAAPITKKKENELINVGSWATVRPRDRLPAYSNTKGEITEMITGKMMIEYQTFFWCLNTLKSLAAISHALDNLMQTPLQASNKRLPMLSPSH